MSKDAKAIAIAFGATVVLAGLSAGLPWAVRRAQHPQPPYTQPLQYIGNQPAPSS
jgi:hypothetical protein